MTARTGALLRRGLPASAGVAAPGDRRFRRPDVRPGNRRTLGRWISRVGRLSISLLLVVFIGYAAFRSARTSRLLSVSHIVVRGNSRLSTDQVEALIQGIRGQNILLANLDLYRSQLMDSPWVARASVRRLLPSTVEVRLVEREPMAITRIDGRLYLVDDAGVVVDEFGPQYREFDLPVVDGLIVPRQTGGPPVRLVDDARAQLTRRFLDALQPAPALRQRVSQIDVSDAHDLIVLLADDPTLVHLGDARFLERLTMYQELAPTLQDRLRSIDYVDMRFDERVYVKSRTQPATASKGKRGPERGDGPRRRG
jgi:cell division protein FtsQ